MAPVVNGEIIKILIPSSLINSVHSEAPQDFATSVASMAECFVAAQADFYFSGNNICYLSLRCIAPISYSLRFKIQVFSFKIS